MRKTFINTVVAADESIAVVGLTIFNPSQLNSTAGLKLYGIEGNLLSTLLEMPMPGKETLFLSPRIFLEPGQELRSSGAEFTIAGSVG